MQEQDEKESLWKIYGTGLLIIVFGAVVAASFRSHQIEDPTMVNLWYIIPGLFIGFGVLHILTMLFAKRKEVQ